MLPSVIFLAGGFGGVQISSRLRSRLSGTALQKVFVPGMRVEAVAMLSKIYQSLFPSWIFRLPILFRTIPGTN